MNLNKSLNNYELRNYELFCNIHEKIGRTKSKIAHCRFLYNQFRDFTHNVHVNKDVSEKKRLINEFLIKSEHAYIIREYKLQEFVKEYNSQYDTQHNTQHNTQHKE